MLPLKPSPKTPPSSPVPWIQGRIREIQEGLGSYARLSGAQEAALLDPTGAVLVRWEGSERSAEPRCPWRSRYGLL